MPHSISPDESKIPDQDAMLETETDNGDTQTSDGTMIADSEAQNIESQTSDAVDQDMAMADVGVQGAQVPEVTVKIEIQSEVKLEDLFADVDSDDEFPSSTGRNIKTSSSPEAPSSPV
jgi:DNA primase small subunit